MIFTLEDYDYLTPQHHVSSCPPVLPKWLRILLCLHWSGFLTLGRVPFPQNYEMNTLPGLVTTNVWESTVRPGVSSFSFHLECTGRVRIFLIVRFYTVEGPHLIHLSTFSGFIEWCQENLQSHPSLWKKRDFYGLDKIRSTVHKHKRS